jgi:FdrA protein
MKQLRLEKSAYLDSVSLMGISRKIGELAGVLSAQVAMATDTNLLLLRESGFDTETLGDVTPGDMVVAIDAESAERLEAAMAAAEREIARGGGTGAGEGAGGSAVGGSGGSGGAVAAPDLTAAIGEHSEINLVFISTPGRYAAREAWRALSAGKHVMIFSDNVSLEDEKLLKGLGRERGLLVMGPDCGTAIISGVGLGFANSVPRGRIGIVAASGTGAQEVSSILARLGLGVSHIIGTGGRDVSDAIGGVMTTMGLEMLARDAATDVLVVISKLPGEGVARRILAAARAAGKPCVVAFAGLAGDGRDRERDDRPLIFARTLTEAAVAAARLATGTAPAIGMSGGESAARVASLRCKVSGERKFLRGLFSGGTLAQEAVALLGPRLGPVHTNMKMSGSIPLDNAARSMGHTVVDLGDDAFTRGRAHPMIDQSYRLARLAHEAADPECAVMLLDVVLGYGCNPDPAGEVAAAIGALPAAAALKKGTAPFFVASVCGTAGDPQNYSLQRRKLEDAGVLVAETNALACDVVAGILGGQTDE